MELNTLVSISKAKKRVVEFIYGTMGQNTSVSGIMMWFMDLESISGEMGGPIVDSGRNDKWMDLVDIPLAMVVGLRVNTLMTKSMGMECTHGQMEESTRATGKKVNNMG